MPVPMSISLLKKLAFTWKLSFPEKMGAPSEVLVLNDLTDLSQHKDFGVRHFSGTSSYKTSIYIDEKDISERKHILLDLGEVREMAKILVNGQVAETLWKPPFRTDITSLLEPGENRLEVRVTNLWVNRLIGDEYHPDEVKWRNAGGVKIISEWPEWLVKREFRPESDRVTWSTRGKIWSKDDPLLPSGLLGPVTLIMAVKKNVP